MAQRAKPMLDPGLHQHLNDQEFGTLSTWCENAKCSITLRQWLGGGRTSAKLAVVLIDDGHPVRKGVLKYCPSKDANPRDFLAFREAAKSGPPGFARKHLVRLDKAAAEPIPNGPEGLFLLMEWRIGGPDNYDTMATLLDREVLGLACETVVKSTLLEWNRVRHEVIGTRVDVSAIEFLREILGRRWEPGGTVHAAAHRLGVSCEEAFMQGPTKLLRNPLAAVTSGEWIDGISVLGFRGNAHGDLHADNILVPRPHDGRPSAAHFGRYLLIDLSTFRSSRLIAVDPAYLLMSIIARRLGSVPATGRRRLARLVLEPQREESGDIPGEITLAVRNIQRARISFTDGKGLYNEWQAESMLATAGCALLFAGWSNSDDDAWWFLELAGMAIEAFTEKQPKRDDLTAESNTRPHDAPSQPRRTPPRPATGRTTQPSLNTSPGHMPTSGSPGRAEPPPSPGRHPSSGRDLTPDGQAPAPTSPAAAFAPAVPGHVISPVPLIIEKGVADCSALADALASEIAELGDDVPASSPSAGLFTARDIVDDLSEAVRNMLAWHDKSTPERHISYLTAIEAVRVQITKVNGILRQISEQGVGPGNRDDATAAIERLQHAMRVIVPPPRP